MKSAARGFTLAELLVTLGLLGIVILSFGTLLENSRLQERLASAESRRLEERWAAAERLREDIHHASSVRLEGGSALVLSTPGGTVRWTSTPEGLAREGRLPRQYRGVAGAAFGIEAKPFGLLVCYRVGEGGDASWERALVGRDLGRRRGAR